MSSGASLARIYAYNHFGLHPEPLLGWFEKYMGGAARPDRAREASDRGILGAGAYWGGHSGQVSPIESSTSAMATAAACGETSGRGSSRGISLEGALSGMWVGAVLHPAVFFALPDCACFRQRRDRQPRSVRTAGRRSFVISVAFAPAETNP